MNKTEYQVTGMTCGSCELNVKDELEEIAGIQQIEVSAKTGKLVVTGPAEIDDAQILAAVAEAGYTAVRTA
ncbi:heavy metal-associated domain-containing protein [Jonesiaceae bacterium BS-20]|uniref:Heavy metal-associated domain-containing protein n=1 Tax=Jonesiaceae bacterium BS-20 TaxID=3120821 RepID=A0AAU7DS46_9MICO